MTLLHKVTATEQLVFEASSLAIRRHFRDRTAHWRYWSLHRVEKSARHIEGPIKTLNFSVNGGIDVPRLEDTFTPVFGCQVCLRLGDDGSKTVFSVDALFPSFGWDGPLDESLQAMSCYFGMKSPHDHSKSGLAKCYLSRKLSLPPRSEDE